MFLIRGFVFTRNRCAFPFTKDVLFLATDPVPASDLRHDAAPNLQPGNESRGKSSPAHSAQPLPASSSSPSLAPLRLTSRTTRMRPGSLAYEAARRGHSGRSASRRERCRRDPPVRCSRFVPLSTKTVLWTASPPDVG
jgi:hypothetical protein